MKWKKKAKQKGKAHTAEAKKEEKAIAAEAKKDEKAPVTYGSMIAASFNNAKEKGDTRGLIAEHGDIKFH